MTRFQAPPQGNAAILRNQFSPYILGAELFALHQCAPHYHHLMTQQRMPTPPPHSGAAVLPTPKQPSPSHVKKEQHKQVTVSEQQQKKLVTNEQHQQRNLSSTNKQESVDEIYLVSFCLI